MLNVLTFILIGVMAGILSGFFGIGGGILIVPALVLLFGYSQHAANGTSLVALLLPVGLLGALTYFRAGKISGDNFKMGLLIALGMFLGSIVGSFFAISTPEGILRKGFAIFLMVVGVRLFFKG